ncbi:MAG TPA: alpha-L-arabinofuranosidase C-terminal domain-containing protein, partial [Opitutaceae bacterium]|nr:alpha-L-arabinofuranosidase C-terminal domain-containing protein [Opitutaceae bacterium]
MKPLRCALAGALALGAATVAVSASATLSVDVARPGAAINPAMWGVFFEDINFGADGGLYAELVKNRGFEFPDPLMGWTRIKPSNARGDFEVRTDDPFNARNARYVRIRSEAPAQLGLSNEGFRGMGVRQGAAYDFSARLRGVAGTPKVKLSLYAENGFVLATAELVVPAGGWRKVTATLRPARTDAKARLAVLLEAPGTVDLDFVSLFPRDTWRGRPGGLRADMVQALADMKPGFFRFPGGCIVEGSVLAHRYQWKNTLGPVEERPVLVNRWNYEFAHRPAPDYFQSFGLGFFEYFQLCEDIGAEPLPIVNCGMACQFNSGELVPLEELEPYIQDALDLIEFANGPPDSPWGARRAALGHPAPFNLKMLGIGNEQWGPEYVERYARFAEVLKRRHPEIALVSDSGPQPEDDRFKFLWSRLRPLDADIIDEHSYAPPEWFLANAHRYDGYDRNGPKVFVGEYAAQSVAVVSPDNRNTWRTALAEAAFMTGLERNADVVRMASYAPLFAHVDAWQWTPDMIWVDNLRLAPTPNYHVQRLFALNRGDRVLPVRLG